MDKILFVTFYGLIDYIADISMAFENNHIIIHDFPLMSYRKDSEKSEEEIMTALLAVIGKYEIINLFWFHIPKNYKIYFTSIKTKYPHVKFIFYNFDDPKSLTNDLVNFSQFIDYFVNPIATNEKKYTCLLGKHIYHLQRYCHLDLLLKKDGVCPKMTDVAIIVNKFEEHDENEKNYLNTMILKIKNMCLSHNYTLKLYGNYHLKNIHNEIYKEESDYLTENRILSQTKIVVLLDYRNNLSRDINQDILHAHLYGRKVLTNYHMINDEIISHHKNIHILTTHNVDLIREIYESSQESCPNCDESHPIAIYGLDHWVKELLKIIHVSSLYIV